MPVLHVLCPKKSSYYDTVNAICVMQASFEPGNICPDWPWHWAWGHTEKPLLWSPLMVEYHVSVCFTLTQPVRTREPDPLTHTTIIDSNGPFLILRLLSTINPFRMAIFSVDDHAILKSTAFGG